VGTNSKVILLIDDQADEREIQRALLTHRGYSVLDASDGARGLEIALEEHPDLILLDVAMPRMDGFEVCRAIRADPRTENIPVLFYTASVVGDLETQIKAAGGSGVLVKPMDPNLVADEVGKLIGGA
jgi:two-component system, cell cycle response regulator DivK